MSRRIAVEVDANTCMGTQLCNAVAPDVFEYQPAEGVTRAQVTAVDDDEALYEAAEKCPVGAIRLRDEATGAAIDV